MLEEKPLKIMWAELMEQFQWKTQSEALLHLPQNDTRFGRTIRERTTSPSVLQKLISKEG